MHSAWGFFQLKEWQNDTRSNILPDNICPLTGGGARDDAYDYTFTLAYYQPHTSKIIDLRTRNALQINS